MKKLCLFLITILFLSAPAFAQKSRQTPKKSSAVKTAESSDAEKENFAKAAAETDLTQRIAALQKFATDFPKSDEKIRALELLVSSRAQLADQKLRGGDATAGIELFKQAVADAPSPLSDKLFAEVVLQFPTNLFYAGQQPAAVEIARSIEEKIGDNAKQILGLATFYIGTENGEEARRLAEKAIALDPQMPAAYQTLGLASRLDFQLEESVAAYAKAAKLDPDSVVSKRSLAEMKRAVGEPSEAAAIYRELLAKNPDDLTAQTGLTLSLFDAEKQPEAETEMSKSLEKNPNNLFLLVGAAYWYAARGDAVKSVDLAQRAVAVEPRYTWAHIALARGLILQNRFADAEKQLLAARQYGNFPTLYYELAAVRLAAGFYEEAARQLEKSFTAADDSIQTKLGNRVPRAGKSFIEVLADERRASIFEPRAADDTENAAKLKALLILNQNLASAETNDDSLEQAVNEFVKGDDKSKTYRQIYAANQLLRAKKDLPKVLDLTRAAVGGVDAALEAPNAPSAVLADELFESRTLAILRGEVVIVPDVSRRTLAAIVRGRIEEISGWTLFNQNKPQEAVVRLKRAVSILPEKSAWWRSSMWHLGVAFDASDKPVEALDAYVKSYLDSAPDAIKYAAIERVYQKVNGGLDGLDKKIGAKPIDNTIALSTSPPETAAAKPAELAPSPAPTVELTPEKTPTPTSEISASPTPEASAAPPKPESAPQVLPAASPAPSMPEKTAVEPAPTPEISTSLAATPETNTKTETAATNPPPATAPLFGSVVITVPKTAAAKPAGNDSKPAQTDEQNTELKPSKTAEKSKDSAATDNSGVGRSRVIVTQNPKIANSESCQINLDQESIGILANGGKLGVLVSLQGAGDVSKITAASSNPTDIEITLDSDIGKSSNSVFFIVKSVSPKTGVFTVTFESPCGKKELQVKVR